MNMHAWIRHNTKHLGVGLIGAGALLLLVLRFVASPVARRIAGAQPAGLIEFAGIPAFFLLAGAGMILFLWEPDT
jgi:hypothetical protein